MSVKSRSSGKHSVEVWGKLVLSRSDRRRLRDFLVTAMGFSRRTVIDTPHLTVYHARRPMPGLEPTSEVARVVVPAAETRFMVLAPGGENPRPHLDPSRCSVGIRVRRQCEALHQILQYRERLIAFETQRVLGSRVPSTRRRSAFGARHFQPHMALLTEGSSIDRDLTRIGIPFREQMGDLTFDKFVIKVVSRNIVKETEASKPRPGAAEQPH